MQEMIYQNKWLTLDQIIILAEGSYKGYEYLVVSYGVYPAAYIALMEGQPFYKGGLCEDVDVNCHGGCTFVEWGYKNLFDRNYKVIGWDYGHFNDFLGFHKNTEGLKDDKKWTTQEMIQECEHVIDQLYFLEHPELIYK
jgi:hypothetical protein